MLQLTHINKDRTTWTLFTLFCDVLAALFVVQGCSQGFVSKIFLHLCLHWLFRRFVFFENIVADYFDFGGGKVSILRAISWRVRKQLSKLAGFSVLLRVIKKTPTHSNCEFWHPTYFRSAYISCVITRTKTVPKS